MQRLGACNKIAVMKRVLLVFLITVSCSRESQQEVQSESLLPAAFKQKLSTDIVLVDVRTPEEFASGFITGAVNIDFKSPDFDHKLDSLDKSQTYMLYCASGARSSKAAALMRAKGFDAVSTLEGGLNAWAEAGLSLY